jgi:methyl-accepting chemotaxis protein
MRDAINDFIKAVTPSFIRRRYTVKFVVSILFVIVVITSVGMFGFVQAQQTVQEDSQNELNTTAETRADAIGSLVQNKQIQTLSISSNDLITSNSRSTVTNYITGRTQDAERFSGPQSGANIAAIHVVTTDGTVFASTSDELVGATIEDIDRPWANNFGVATGIDAANGVRTMPASKVVDGTRRLSFVSPVGGTDRVVIIESPLGVTLESDSPTFTTAIINGDGSLVTERSLSEAGFGASEGAQGRLDEVLASQGAMASAGFIRTDGRLYAVRPIQSPGTAGWLAVTSISEGEAFAVAQSVGQTIGVIIITALLSLGLVGIALGLQTVTPLTRLRRKIQRMEEGDLSVDLETGREDEIGRLYTGFGSLRDSLRDRISEIEQTNRRLERKATEYSEVMRACADGDLTQRMDPSGADESMAEIADEFNEMVEELETTTQEIKRFADQVAISSREVTVSADEVLTASEQVTETVQDINEGAEQQNQSLQAINTDVEELSTTIDDIARSSTEVAGLASETVESGREGRAAAQAAISDMDEVTEESEVAVQQMEQLEEQTQQIDELIEFVDEIARRTNMLALNANIEATRSESEADSGFGVIANEIKQLSEESQQATENIAQRLEQIQQQTGEAASVVEQTSQQITDSAANVREAVRALQEVTEYAEETNEGIQSISEANAEQVETTSEVATAVQDVAEISTRTSREADTVAALAAEQTAAVTQVSRSAGDLSDRAEQLSERLDDFETDVPVEVMSEPASSPATAATGDAASGGMAAFDPTVSGESGADGDAPSDGDTAVDPDEEASNADTGASGASFSPARAAGADGSASDANGEAAFDPGRAGASDEGDGSTERSGFQPGDSGTDGDGDGGEADSESETGFRPMTDGEGDDGA